MTPPPDDADPGTGRERKRANADEPATRSVAEASERIDRRIDELDALEERLEELLGEGYDEHPDVDGEHLQAQVDAAGRLDDPEPEAPTAPPEPDEPARADAVTRGATAVANRLSRQADMSRQRDAYNGAMEAIFAILIATGLGWWADREFGTSPTWISVGALIGFAAFVLRIVRMRDLVEDPHDDEEEDGKSG